MSTAVMKFGGASVASPEHFKRIAELIIQKKKETSRLAIVVSAMGDTTNQLYELARKVHPNPPRREQDMLVSTGERISISLLAMALAVRGIQAISFTGSQSGIITSSNHNDASIIDVRPIRLIKHLDLGDIVIVAGFQGVSEEKEITTLGRGGSDTSAVALGIALKAEEVVFYKDVKGIYDADPKKTNGLEPYLEMEYEAALEICEKGAKILHPRCIRLARENGIPLRVRSFKTEDESHPGTIISTSQINQRSEPPIYEKSLVGNP